jgi:hypothetical protein
MEQTVNFLVHILHDRIFSGQDKQVSDVSRYNNACADTDKRVFVYDFAKEQEVASSVATFAEIHPVHVDVGPRVAVLQF